MTCAQANKFLGRYVAGLLSRGDSERLETHLCECGLCEVEFERLVSRGLSSDTLTTSIPTGLREEILSAIIPQPHDVADLCYILAPQISAYLDGELAGGEHDEIARHLASCRPCTRLAESLTSLDRVMVALPAFEPSTQLKKRIVSLIPAPMTSGVWSRVAAALRWRPLQIGLPVAAMAMLALLATIPFWQGPEMTLPRPQPTAAGTTAHGASLTTPTERAIDPSVPKPADGISMKPLIVASAPSRAVTRPALGTIARSARLRVPAVGPSGITARGIDESMAAPSDLTTVSLPDSVAADAVLTLPVQRGGSAVYHLASATRPERLADEPARLQFPVSVQREGAIGRPAPSLEPEEEPSADVVLTLDVVADWQPSSQQNILVPAGVYAYE